MLREVRRGLLFGLGFWLAPLVLAVGIAGVGIFAGFASTEPVTGTVPTVEPAGKAGEPPVSQPAQAAPRVNAAEGVIIRFGRTTQDGRILLVQDRAGRIFQVLVTPETIIKRGGRVVRPAQIRVGDQIVGIGARQPNGQFKAIGIRVVPPENEPTQ
ncbi:MAG: hypothetical protein KatS3mg060_0633 [Dehalococcoidia bacterium]|nr:MAG: hypothetical protein KatS3mg060_0633 [Dehalococcoidia bacterium]